MFYDLPSTKENSKETPEEKIVKSTDQEIELEVFFNDPCKDHLVIEHTSSQFWIFPKYFLKLKIMYFGFGKWRDLFVM